MRLGILLRMQIDLLVTQIRNKGLVVVYIRDIICIRFHTNSPCTPKALSISVERQILGVKLAHCLSICGMHTASDATRRDAALRKHYALV